MKLCVPWQSDVVVLFELIAELEVPIEILHARVKKEFYKFTTSYYNIACYVQFMHRMKEITQNMHAHYHCVDCHAFKKQVQFMHRMKEITQNMHAHYHCVDCHAFKSK